MSEILVGIAWGALRLVSSLAFRGFKKLLFADEEAPLIKWSGDVVLKAREKSRQVSRGQSEHQVSACVPAVGGALLLGLAHRLPVEQIPRGKRVELILESPRVVVAAAIFVVVQYTHSD